MGAIYTFATGNGGAGDSCAYSGYVNSIYTIAISGVNLNNSRPSYAEECCGIMVSAYSGDVVSNHFTRKGCCYVCLSVFFFFFWRAFSPRDTFVSWATKVCTIWKNSLWDI